MSKLVVRTLVLIFSALKSLLQTIKTNRVAHLAVLPYELPVLQATQVLGYEIHII
ncbi:MAG: hypothetical protein V7K97_17785 [Nostoc sp.]|uniref:hypothetical protein n=1 Tax=Nostoc sp. TaxID=1180 RepID=UPI002FF93449